MTRAGAGGEAVGVDVDGRTVRLTNLAKVLWPSVGMTKADLVGYYVRLAPALLPHLADRPLTLHRFPDGVEGTHWYETRCPPHPPWVRTQEMYVFQPGADVRAAVVDDVASLVWAANAAAVELHPYPATARDLRTPTAAIFDLDPGAPATVVDAARVALSVRGVLDEHGLAGFPKTSGALGLHVYVPLNTPHTFAAAKAFARAVGRRLARERPDQVVDVTARAQRAGRVLVDWGQNDAGRSTVAPYSLRGLWYPTVSMPLTWAEVEQAAATGNPGRVTFVAGDVPFRLDRVGDLFAPVLRLTQSLPDLDPS